MKTELWKDLQKSTKIWYRICKTQG